MNFSPRNPFAGRPAVLLIALVAIGIACLLGEMLLSARQDSIDKAVLNITNERNIAVSNLELLLQPLTLSLDSVADGLQMTRAGNLPEKVRRAILFNKATLAAPFGSVLVLDATGHVTYDSRHLDPPKFDMSDRNYFKTFRDGSSAPVFVSAPLLGRLSGKMVLAVSRPLRTEAGGFDGIVTGTLLVDRLVDLLSPVQAESGATVSLYRTDGIRLLRVPGEVQPGGRRDAQAPVFQHLPKASSGYFEANVQGESRLFSYRRISTFPLVLVVSLPRSVALQDWTRFALTSTAISLCLLAVVLVVSAFFYRELNRRFEAERSLRSLAGELDRQAHTDVLTGVGNRRTFEENFDTEWRRHARQRAALALVIVDVDLFKAYNDSLGHAAGDGALVTVARCLVACARRAGDSIARIGGEEFVILLPETDEAGARAVAERFRDMLAKCSVIHPQSPSGRLTVSIGIASMKPSTQVSRAALLDAADKALYHAKSAGRDCLRIAA